MHASLFRILAAMAAAFVALLAAPTASAEAQRDRHVSAELIAEVTAAAPGSSFDVVLRLVHDKPWHTYWKHSATGYATSLRWDMPAGFSAGALQWPTPILYEMAGYFEYVHEGETLLPVRITVPADAQPGQSLILRATASWLMCTDVCIPGSVDLSLPLTIAAETTPAAPEALEVVRTARAALPPRVPDITAEAWQDADAVFLHITSASAPLPTELYFFDDQGYTEPTRSQESVRLGANEVVLKLRDDPAGVDAVERLSGVLAAGDGWGALADTRGIEIDAPLRTGTPPFAAQLNTAASTAGAAPAADRGFAGILVLALLGGLILNLMPCVFPVISIKIMSFVGKAGHSHAKIAAHGLVFTLGVLASFWVLALLLIALRAGGQQLGWGFQLQSPVFVYGLTVFFLIFALNMSGLFEVGQSVMGAGQGLTHKQGMTGSFFSGVLATVVATPCAAPFLAPALGAALALPALASLLVFTAIGVGLALPYLVLSIFPGLLARLPKPGPWMETFKQLMAFPLYATAGYLLWVLMGQLTDDFGYLDTAMRNVVFALVAVALAAWVYGRWGAAHRRKPVRLRAYAASLALLTAGFAYGYPRPYAHASADAPQVTWEAWAPGKPEQLAAEGRTVYVDFTARWCVTCQTNKAAVFGSADVRRFFAENNIVTLRADWTNADPDITEALAAFGRSAVPFNLIYTPGRDAPIILPELLTPGIVLDALRTDSGSK